ncbi:MAG: methyltetrahydrofolate--corrinoid methyltransferase [Spirochaetes bacterium]|nr:MAG: methyltetrahydrofolate--corrinoid methyltransferase [Spirochaetota bacterium]
MILIGERINAGFKDIKEAIVNKDGDVIREWARKQADGKASYIDVNLGTASNKAEDLCWMIEQVQKEVDVPISIDNNKPSMLKEAIPVCKKPPLVNSTTAVEEKLDEILPIIAEHGASIIGLVMDEAGSPKSADKRVENAGKIVAKAMEYDITPDRLYLDPIVMPLKYMQDQAKEILSAANQFQLFSDPPCHVVCGLSNISNGAKHKRLINRTFAVMMIANGMDAVICDVLDEELVNAILTAELVMNKEIYADAYLEAFRK